MSAAPCVDYQTDPSQYQHRKLQFSGPFATLTELGGGAEHNDALNHVQKCPALW